MLSTSNPGYKIQKSPSWDGYRARARTEQAITNHLHVQGSNTPIRLSHTLFSRRALTRSTDSTPLYIPTSTPALPGHQTRNSPLLDKSQPPKEQLSVTMTSGESPEIPSPSKEDEKDDTDETAQANFPIFLGTLRLLELFSELVDDMSVL